MVAVADVFPARRGIVLLEVRAQR